MLFLTSGTAIVAGSEEREEGEGGDDDYEKVRLFFNSCNATIAGLGQARR